MARAPEEVVDEQRERREEAEARRAKILEALERLKSAAYLNAVIPGPRRPFE